MVNQAVKFISFTVDAFVLLKRSGGWPL